MSNEQIMSITISNAKPEDLAEFAEWARAKDLKIRTLVLYTDEEAPEPRKFPVYGLDRKWIGVAEEWSEELTFAVDLKHFNNLTDNTFFRISYGSE